MNLPLFMSLVTPCVAFRIPTRISMTVAPIGPFCPFRSSSSASLNSRMENLSVQAPAFMQTMARFQLDMQMGVMPDPVRMNEVADELETALDSWEGTIGRMALSSDFQTREYYKFTLAHLEREGESFEDIGKMMRWQTVVMRCIGTNTPPPLPPPGIDLEKIMEKGSGKDGKSPMSAMVTAQTITSSPFTGAESAFDSKIVKDEYEALSRDHMQIIEFGGNFGSFDRLGKIAFVNQLEQIEERWDVFLARFSLMGMLDPTFAEESAEFLKSLGMDEGDFRLFLKRAHQMMRDDAEGEILPT